MEEQIKALIEELDSNLNNLKKDKEDAQQNNDPAEYCTIIGEIKATKSFIQKLKSLLK